MNVGKAVEWAIIAIVAYLGFRWLSNAFQSDTGSAPLTQTWQPGFYPPQIGGGLVYLSPGLTYGGRNPNWPGSNSGRNGGGRGRRG